MTTKQTADEDLSMSEITVVEFESSTFGNSYVSELSDGPPYTVHGVALGSDDVTVGASGIKKKWPATELEQAADSLRGTNLVVDHNNDATGVVGRVTKSGYKEETGVVYEAELYDEDLAEKVKSGLLEVSIRGYHADVDALEEDEETGAKVVEDIQFDNLSIVPTGAAPSNTLEMGAHAELSAAELSAFTDSLEAAELQEIEPGMWVQSNGTKGITISQVQDGEIEVDIYEESDGKWRSTGETEMFDTGSLDEWDVDEEEDIGTPEDEEDEEDEEENAELVSKDDKVTWESSGGSAQGIVRERKTDGCFNEEIDGDQEVCADDDEAVVLIEIVDGGEATGTMVAHKEGTLNSADFEMAATYDDYPEAAKENAQMALDAREETGNPNDCGTSVGWNRANQLASGEALSRDTIAKMSAFNRHRSNSDMSEEEGEADCGWMMWKAWGGDEGVDWAQSKLESIEEENEAVERGTFVKFKDVNNNWKYGQIIGMNQDGVQTVATIRLFTESGDKLDETVEKPVQGLDPWDMSPEGEMPERDAQRGPDAIDAPEFSEGEMVQWQVNPQMMGKIVHVDEDKQIIMVEVMEDEGGELVSSGFTVTAGYSDLEPVDGMEDAGVTTKDTPTQDAQPSHDPMGEPESILDLFKKFMSTVEGNESSLKDFAVWAVETEELANVDRGESEEKKLDSEQKLKESRAKDPKWLDSEIEELALDDVDDDHKFNSREEAMDFIEDNDMFSGVHKMGSFWVPGEDHEEYMDNVSESSKHGDDEDEEEMAAIDAHRHTHGVLEAFLDDSGSNDSTVSEFLEWIDNDPVVRRSIDEFTESDEGGSVESEVSVLMTWLNDVINVTDDEEKTEDSESEEASADEGKTMTDNVSDVEELQEYDMHTPDWSGTTESDWSTPDMEDFDTDDLGEIANHFLISSSGFPPENFTDLKLPVVEPNGDLNVNALAAVKGGRGVSAVDGLSSDMEEEIVNWVNNTANEEFDRDWGNEEEEAQDSDVQEHSIDGTSGRPTPQTQQRLGGVRVLSGDDLQQMNSKTGESDADSLTTYKVDTMTNDIEEKLAELENPVAVEADEVDELRDKADRFEEMSENLEALRERTDILDDVDRSQVEELAESDDAVVVESGRYDELQDEAQQVKGVYAASLAEEYPAFTAEELSDKFGIEELREKFEEQIGDVEEELTSASAEPRSQDADEESLEEAASEETEEEELSDEVASKQEEIRDKILGGN